MPEIVANTKEEVQTLLNVLGQDLKDTVRRIEDGPKLTKDHYGEYMSFLSNFEGNTYICTMALALVEAGRVIGKDNRDGVRSALQIMRVSPD